MSDELREILRRGAGSPQPAWDFQSLWRRSQRRRVRNTALGVVATVGVVAAVIASVPSITSNQRVEDGRNRIAPASTASWERIPAAPIEGRFSNVAVWTGEEMLIWGGRGVGSGSAGLVNGAAFDPDKKDWRPMSDGPLEFSGGRAAVWTGDEMIVWGGETGGGGHVRPDNGAAYDPRRDTWTELPRSPYWSLAGHSAIWTGDEMIVWGGVDMEGDGAAFDPRSSEWRTIARAPIDGRFRHSAVWTGTEMIVWGGGGVSPHARGAAYDPASDSWRELPPAPISGQDQHAATWTGEEMIVWGGWETESGVSDGAAYDPVSDTWRELPDAPVSQALSDMAAVWTGHEMIVVGGDGALAAYSPGENEWATLSEPPMEAPGISPTLLRADDETILWGGTLTPRKGYSNEGAILRLTD